MRRAGARHATSRGGTTRAGRSSAASARSRPRSRGTTTTARSTGRATAASCCACGRAAPRVLEGREPRRLRRRPLARRPTPTSTARARPTIADMRQRWHADDPASRSATCAPTSSSPRATPTTSTRRRIRETPTRDGTGRASRARCAAATPTRATSTRRSPTEAQRRDAGQEPAAPTSRASGACHCGPRHRRSGSPGAPRTASTFPPFGDKFTPLAAGPAGNPQSGRPVARRVLRARPVRRTYALAQRLARGARDAGGLRAGRAALPAATASTTPRRRRARRTTSTASCSTPRAATASSTRARWRCCCGWAAIPARVVDRLHLRRARRQDARVRRARLRRPLVGRGLLPGLRLGHVRPDAGHRAAAQPAERGAADGARSAAPARRASAATGRPTAAAGARVDAAAAPWWRWSRCSARRRARCSARRWLVLRRRAPRGAAARRRSLLASSSARCAAPAASRPRARRCTRSSSASPARPAAAGYVRALREKRYRDAPGAPTRAQRRGLRAELGRGGGLPAACAPGGRCPRGSRGVVHPRALRLDGLHRWTTCTTCSSEARRCWRTGTSTRPPSRWPRPATRAGQDLDPRGARPGLLPLRQFEEARVEFEAVVERAPTNDYALFCLGRALMRAGPSGGGPQAARAGRPAAPGTARLPDLQGARGQGGVSASGAITRTQLFRGRKAKESGRSPAFLLTRGE